MNTTTTQTEALWDLYRHVRSIVGRNCPTGPAGLELIIPPEPLSELCDHIARVDEFAAADARAIPEGDSE